MYNTIPAEHLLRLLDVLDDSWSFARKFNADKELRMQLWKVGKYLFNEKRSRELLLILNQGFMKQLPNLLKQESSAAATLVNVLLKMYNDPREAHRATRKDVVKRLVPSVNSYLSLLEICS